MSGLSWFAVLKISSLPPARASHAQPLPNRVVAALASCSLNFAKSPNVFLMASASVPVGCGCGGGHGVPPRAIGIGARDNPATGGKVPPLTCGARLASGWVPDIFPTRLRVALVSLSREAHDGALLRCGHPIPAALDSLPFRHHVDRSPLLLQLRAGSVLR